MHYVAIFSHAFKRFEDKKPVSFRHAYKIYDSKTRQYASTYLGPVIGAHSSTPNAPMAQALGKALIDPALDRIDSPRTIICLFSNHKIIHEAVKSYILRNKADLTPGPYERAMRQVFSLINRQKTVSAWNNCQKENEDNKCKFVLKGMGSVWDPIDEIHDQDVPLPLNWHKDAIELACSKVHKSFQEQLLRSQGLSMFDRRHGNA